MALQRQCLPVRWRPHPPRRPQRRHAGGDRGYAQRSSRSPEPGTMRQGARFSFAPSLRSPIYTRILSTRLRTGPGPRDQELAVRAHASRRSPHRDDHGQAREPGRFPAKQIELLKTFADQAVIAIENVRLFKELEARNTDLSVALDRQMATSEILKVISQSQTDVQPVFDTIVRNAVRLGDARFGVLHRFDGEQLHVVAHAVTPEAMEALRRAYPMRPARSQVSGRASSRVLSSRSGTCERTPSIRPIWRRRGSGEACSACRCSGRTEPHRHHCHPAERAGALCRQPHRAPEDLRRPGRHRHRERAAL